MSEQRERRLLLRLEISARTFVLLAGAAVQLGATAANVGVIAGELAEKTKEAERAEHALCIAPAP